ncbi:MAG: hypothetical protein ACI9S9_005023, partial [Planctomycetota bacterium]
SLSPSWRILIHSPSFAEVALLDANGVRKRRSQMISR